MKIQAKKACVMSAFSRRSHSGRAVMLSCFHAFILSFFVGCSPKADPADVAAQAAKQYYDYLLEGKYEAFVDGRYQPEAIPAGYRDQLISLARMFVSQQQLEHRGLKETRIVNAEADTARHEANVFLVFCYGDSTSEEVCIPMVESRGLWYLR